MPCGAANLYCPAGSAAPIFVDAGFYSIGNYDGSYSSSSDTPPTASVFANANASSSNGQAAGAGRPDDDRGAAFRSGVAVCPAGWYCTGDGAGSACPPGLYGSEVGIYVFMQGYVQVARGRFAHDRYVSRKKILVSKTSGGFALVFSGNGSVG